MDNYSTYVVRLHSPRQVEGSYFDHSYAFQEYKIIISTEMDGQTVTQNILSYK
jgi:hypothetical protein